jgi:uncharacterized membrane protein
MSRYAAVPPSWRRVGSDGDDGAVTILAGGPPGVLAPGIFGPGLLGPGGALGAGMSAGTVRPVPTGAAYTILLMLHVLCALVGFGTVVATGVQAARARRGPSAPGAAAVLRYFRPGVNWAGRALYGVPVFGFSLLAASNGAFSSGDGFVVVGLLIWIVTALMAEVMVWPGERRIQVELIDGWDEGRTTPALDRDCRRVTAAAVVVALLFVLATVFMIGKP